MELWDVEACIHVLQEVLPEPHAGLLAGLLFGVKTSVPKELYTALVSSGTLHIIALSGMNISIISRMVQGGLVPVVGQRVASLGTLFLIVWFVWFVGPSPSIVRAAIMGGLSLMATVLGRQYWALYAWCLAVVGMLLFHPLWIGDISFQLSVFATLGIILFGTSRVASLSQHQSIQWKRVVMGMIRDNFHLTLAAQVFTIPIIFWYFHRISLVSPIANLLIGWVISPLTGVGWITVIASVVWLPLGRMIAWIDWIGLEYLIQTIYFVSKLPFASIGI